MKTHHPAGPAVWLLSFIGLLTLTPSAHAGDGGPFSIGARAVSFIPKDGSTAWNGGLQGRLRLPLFFAAELSADHRKYDAGSRTVEDYPVQLSALIYVLPKIIMVQPYIIAGGGWYDTKVETPGGADVKDSRFAPHAGAGIEFSLGSKWFVDTTYRYVWLSDVATVETAGSMVTVGLNYRI